MRAVLAERRERCRGSAGSPRSRPAGCRRRRKRALVAGSRRCAAADLRVVLGRQPGQAEQVEAREQQRARARRCRSCRRRDDVDRAARGLPSLPPANGACGGGRRRRGRIAAEPETSIPPQAQPELQAPARRRRPAPGVTVTAESMPACRIRSDHAVRVARPRRRCSRASSRACVSSSTISAGVFETSPVVVGEERRGPPAGRSRRTTRRRGWAGRRSRAGPSRAGARRTTLDRPAVSAPGSDGAARAASRASTLSA